MVIREALTLWEDHEVLIMLEELLEKTRGELILSLGDELPQETEERLTDWILRRKGGEPLQYILGKWWFYGLEIQLIEPVLIPRPETEQLVALALPHIHAQDRVLDLCTGSGAIALAIANAVPDAIVTATDLSPAAIRTAEHNRDRLGLRGIQILQGDLFEPVTGERFHLILSNPPYISTEDMEKLEREVLQEPRLALWGGDDGLSIYRRLTMEAPAHLYNGGRLMLEIGSGQGEDLLQLMAEAGFTEIEIYRDLAGHDRIVSGQIR